MTVPEGWEGVEEPSAEDLRLSQILQDLTTRLHAGEAPDLDTIVARYPDLGDEIRDLWAATLIAEEVARPWQTEMSRELSRPEDPASRLENPPEFQGQIFGDHVLIDELGRGGMGIVYRARHSENGRVVALKRLLRGEFSSPKDIARFRAEADAAARLVHPHIVPLHYQGEHEGLPYFVMSYVEGTTLAKRLAEGPTSPTEAARLLLQVCGAIEHAHGQGVMHRDLKPSNILIDRQGQPYVSDFGLAKVSNNHASLTESGAIVGTPSYLSPEQATVGRGNVGPASDVYSLGAILYQMLTGRPPFLAATPFDTILLVLEQDPVPPRLLNPKVPLDLEMIALRCLQKSPELRYESAEALKADLEAFLSGERVSARSASLRAIASRLLSETHHAPVLENWGLLWICHSVALLVFFGVTNSLSFRGITSRWPYVLIFTVGLGAWAATFWAMRRRLGPITFVERQLAHVWGAGVVGINLIFLVEWLLGLPVLTLSPMVAVCNGMLFMIKGGILSGAYYAQALVTFLAVFPMALYPRFAPIIFGVVGAFCFLSTGIKYHLRHIRARRLLERASPEA
ncbi:serine/threonine-protein kinase [Singulisphaera sp. PoT]|uniref:serine/threonine-protein kinase n=1 Tax=Singulisphaera sp. PoT TaxID=3411797 RepID=UPI003BF5CEA4